MRSCRAGRAGECGARSAAFALMLLALGILAVPIAGNGQEPKELPQGLDVPEPRPLDQAELAGLTPGTHPEVLTAERAYTLAIIRARAPEDRLAEALDPKALGERAARLGVADFARFRDEFLRADRPDSPFRDPSAAMLGVWEQQMAAENAAREIQAIEGLVAICKQLAPGEGRERAEIALDGLGAELERARRAFAEARRLYRDRLDALKVELGLAPHAPVVADAEQLAPFRAVFDAIDRWQGDPRRSLDDLPRLVGRLAPLDGGVPGLAAVAADPARLEPALRASESLAIRNRGGDDRAGRIGLQVRRRIRQIVESHSAYESARRELVAAIRLKDGEFEALVSAPIAGPNGAVNAVNSRDLIAFNAAVNACETRLVSVWASFQADRLALARELRSMPAGDWASFYAGLAVPLADHGPPPSPKAP